MNNSTTTLADVTRILDGFYPPSTAQSWDAVGLVTGDPEQPIERVLFAVDPAMSVIDEAVTRIKDSSITGYIYDPSAAKLVKAKNGSSA